MSFFCASDLAAGYGGRRVIEGVSFCLEAGRVVGVLGANGSGKTTLIKAVCGILPHGGSCVLEGRRLEGLPPKELAGLCGYIPQRSGISIGISVLDVVLMGQNPRLRLLERPSGEMKERARRALSQVGLRGREEENYLELSEGQKQLCILARALSSGGKLLLLDEPESALDFLHRYRTLELLKEWAGKERRAVMAALHDPSLSLNCCDRLLLLSKGRILAELSPETDPLEEMEEKLSALYGPVSLQRCRDRSGQEQLVMLRETAKELRNGALEWG